jgi:hypothetical protein
VSSGKPNLIGGSAAAIIWVVLEENTNITVLHANAGILYHF